MQEYDAMKCLGQGLLGTRALAMFFAALALCCATPAFGQTCNFRANQPTTASFGAINPSLATTMTFSVVLRYSCTGGATASFTITGAHDTGPGAYRLQNQTQTTQFMPYSVTTVNLPGNRITLNGQLVAANYRNAYVGNYADTLTVVVLP
jgi:hypothetical protein